VIQGLGGGMLMPVMFIVLARQAGPRRLGRLMAVLGVSTLLGPMWGPKQSLRISLTGKRFEPVCAVTHTYPSIVTGNTHMAEIRPRTKESGEQPRQDQFSRVSRARRCADRLSRRGGTG
jgi:hypothetical protein